MLLSDIIPSYSHNISLKGGRLAMLLMLTEDGKSCDDIIPSCARGHHLRLVAHSNLTTAKPSWHPRRGLHATSSS
jgi:hypothetical protein